MIGNSFQSLIIINAFSKSRPHFGAGNRDARPFCSAPGGGNSSKQGEKINFCRSLFPERGNLPTTSPFMSPISSARLPPQPWRCLPGQTRLHSKAEPGAQRTKPGLRGDTGGTVTNTQRLELADPSRARPSLPVLSCAPLELGHLAVHVSATRTSAQHIWGSHISAVHSSGTHVSKKRAPPGRVPPSLQGCESRRCSAPKGMLGAGDTGPDPGDQQ